MKHISPGDTRVSFDPLNLRYANKASKNHFEMVSALLKYF